MLDVETLRFVLAVVSLAVLALFFLGVYRPTHSPFSGWWTISLLCAATSSLLLLGDDTSAQTFTNPASSAVAAMGAVGVWFATRSLRQRRSSVWLLLAAGAACAVAGAFDPVVEPVGGQRPAVRCDGCGILRGRVRGVGHVGAKEA